MTIERTCASVNSQHQQRETDMLFRNFGANRGVVDGLGDESVPWWLAPYVRDFGALARSSAIAKARTAQATNAAPTLAFAELVGRISDLVPVARANAHIKETRALAVGVGGALSADIDFYCGTPPRPHHLLEAALAVSLVAANLHESDSAKALLVSEADRLQEKINAGR
jgi:hypothetical protein